MEPPQTIPGLRSGRRGSPSGPSASDRDSEQIGISASWTRDTFPENFQKTCCCKLLFILGKVVDGLEDEIEFFHSAPLKEQGDRIVPSEQSII